MAVVVFGAASALAIATALADNPVGSGFTIDGTVPDAGTTSFLDPVGSVKELGPKNSNSTKVGVVNEAPTPMLDFTSINGGDDLSGMWLATHVDPSTKHIWLYLAWKRLSATTSQVLFEFDQSPQPAACNYTGIDQSLHSPLSAAEQTFIATCNPWANRTVGDFAINWDLQGNSTTLGLRTFDGSGFGSLVSLPAGTALAAYGAGNDAKQGEAAIDLTAAGIFPADGQATSCKSFANVIAATVTGNSDTADFKDTILADTSGVGISNCGEIRVTKHTNPSGGTGSFPYTVARADSSALKYSGATQITGTLTGDLDSDLLTDVKTGTNFTLAEGALAADWTKQSIVCTKGNTSYNVFPGNQTFNVEAGVITNCVITNDKKPQLTLVKSVVNDNGGSAAATAWTLNASGPTAISGASGSGPVTNAIVTAGTYTLSESGGPAGYSSTGVWACTGASVSNGNQITLGAGAVATCTITNDDDKPSLTLIKQVDNNGIGTAVPTDWLLSAAGPSPLSGQGGATSGNGFLAGQYTLSESGGPSGYTAGSWQCSGGSQAGDKITVGLGQSATCTITNTLKVGTITVTKDFVGAPAGATATLRIKQGASVLTSAHKADGGSISGVFKAGSYTIDEVSSAGDVDLGVYESSVLCTDGQTVVASDPNGPAATFDLADGHDVACTITNKRKPELTVAKELDPASDTGRVEFSVNGVGFDNAHAGYGDGQGTGAILAKLAGNVVSETAHAGTNLGDYDATWSCSNGSSGTGTSIPAFAMAYGEKVTCTFTNHRKPQIELRKVFDPATDAGRVDFTLNGAPAAGNAQGYANGDGTGFVNAKLNDNTASETGHAGTALADYVSEWSCSNGASGSGTSILTVDNLDLGYGDNILCTFTNHRKPRLTVTKDVVGDAQATFDLAVDGTKVLVGVNDATTGPTNYLPGDYSVAETVGNSDVSVDPGVWDVVYSGDCAPDGHVSLAYGDVKSCTITNSKRPKLTVTKVVVGDTASSFDLSVGATKVIDDGKNGATDTRTYSPSTVSVTETLGDGAAVDTGVWDVVYSGDCDQNGSVQLAYGDDKSCTITNSKRPQVKVVKEVVPANDGGTFNLAINGTSHDNGGAGFGDGQGTAFVPVAKGDVTVSEGDHGSTLVSSYFNDVACDSQKGGASAAPHSNRTYTFAADYGDVVTCTFTNERKPSSIDVTKTPNPSSVDEPGGSVTYTVAVQNTSAVDHVLLTAASFVDKVNTNAPADAGSVVPISPDCNGATAGDGFPITLDPQGGAKDSVTCAFTLAVAGNGGDKVNDRITVTGKDDANRNVSDYAEATVDIKNVNPAIDVQKTVKSTGSFGETASLPEPGGTFTYQVVVTNASSASSDPLTLTELEDDVYGDLNGKGTCSVPQTIAVGGAYTCQFTGTFNGNPGASETDTVTATAHDDENTSVSDTDTAKVEITDVPSSIEVTKTPSPTSVAEPGGPVEFTVTVRNTSTTDSVTLDEAGFVDKVGNGQPAAIADIDCNGVTAGNGLPLTLAPSETATCTFTKTVTGQPGDVVHDEVTVTGTDDDSGHPSDKGEADVPVTDVPTKLAVVKTADPTSVQEGTRPIAFTISITNVLTFTADGMQWTAVDDITVFSLQDDKLGDLDAAGDVTCKVGGVTKAWPITIGPGQSIVCTVTRNITGSPSNPHVNTVTATGYDSDHPNGCAEVQTEPSCKKASGSATVTFTPTPPPPPSPKSDVTVTKTATPAVTLPLGGGSAPITYTIAAKNNGPDAAQNVHVSDAAPVGVAFVSATIGKGSCTTTPQAVDCTISSLAPGESVPITINATVNATGTKTNVVVISNTTPADTNPGNNTASAITIVTAPATPPTPKPKPQPEICETLIATPNTLKGNGKSQKVKVTVKKGSNGVAGAKVKITGAGISKTVRTGKNGVVIATVKPAKPGIIRVSIVGAKACNTQRIGAVGVYEPPVTG